MNKDNFPIYEMPINLAEFDVDDLYPAVYIDWIGTKVEIITD